MKRAFDISSQQDLQRRPLVLIDAGLSDYETIYEMQRDLVNKKKRGRDTVDYLIFVEHPEVYTYGRKPREIRDKPEPKGRFIERGGGVTYHNPGQLVCYPILSLREGERDLHGYLRRLESVLIDLLRDLGMQAERRPGATGVWVAKQEKKIASIGVAISNWITYHGCALNVENDLSGFQKINPCGFPPQVMTSIKEQLGTACPPMDQIKECFLHHFSSQCKRYPLV